MHIRLLAQETFCCYQIFSIPYLTTVNLTKYQPFLFDCPLVEVAVQRFQAQYFVGKLDVVASSSVDGHKRFSFGLPLVHKISYFAQLSINLIKIIPNDVCKIMT